MLQNVIRKAVRLSDKNTSVEIDCWTQIKKIEGLIFFTVQFTGDQVSLEEKNRMFMEIGDQSGEKAIKNDANQ